VFVTKHFAFFVIATTNDTWFFSLSSYFYKKYFFQIKTNEVRQHGAPATLRGFQNICV